MGKVLLWLGISLGLMFVMRLIAHNKAKQRNPFTQSNQTRQTFKRSWTRQQRATEQMVRCDHCGVHLPTSEATNTQSGVWCSAEHAKLGRPG
jgi:uncharacterized protein